MEMMHEELTIDIRVRAYRSADESVVVWLHRNGHLHGDAEGELTAVLRSITDASPASRHHVLVVEVDGQVVGATATARQREPIGHLLWLCIAPDWQAEQIVAERLVETATAHAREQGWLKLVVHTSLAASQVAGFFHHMGFRFSRERGVGGAHVLEFYLDLYVSPHSQKPRLRAARRQSE
jgi:N-acetylglutamate synthase-like GNAT family acetyltransferase